MLRNSRGSETIKMKFLKNQVSSVILVKTYMQNWDCLLGKYNGSLKRTKGERDNTVYFSSPVTYDIKPNSRILETTK